MRGIALAIAVCSTTVCGFSSAETLSLAKTCSQFRDAVVSIQIGQQPDGTGFLVTKDGYILTAHHVAYSPEGNPFSPLTITLSDGSSFEAKSVLPSTVENTGQDYALLKITAQKELPFLSLGDPTDIQIGADAAIIGFPFSAISKSGPPVDQKFCLSATFAATNTESVTVNVEVKNVGRGGVVTSTKGQRGVWVHVVYFQGPSVKGVSGSPLISRDSGRVVGIVSTKLTGIGDSLVQLEKETAAGAGNNVSISGLVPGPAIYEIVTTLDRQLANGLGSAVGIDEPKKALEKAKK